jgi:hypothetical protein
MCQAKITDLLGESKRFRSAIAENFAKAVKIYADCIKKISKRGNPKKMRHL